MLGILSRCLNAAPESDPGRVFLAGFPIVNPVVQDDSAVERGDDFP